MKNSLLIACLLLGCAKPQSQPQNESTGSGSVRAYEPAHDADFMERGIDILGSCSNLDQATYVKRKCDQRIEDWKHEYDIRPKEQP